MDERVAVKMERIDNVGLDIRCEGWGGAKNR